jgi:hypothetical protein
MWTTVDLPRLLGRILVMLYIRRFHFVVLAVAIECCICDLSDTASAFLLHAIHHWPEGVSKNLWPFALKNTCLQYLEQNMVFKYEDT